MTRCRSVGNTGNRVRRPESVWCDGFWERQTRRVGTRQKAIAKSSEMGELENKYGGEVTYIFSSFHVVSWRGRGKPFHSGAMHPAPLVSKPAQLHKHSNRLYVTATNLSTRWKLFYCCIFVFFDFTIYFVDQPFEKRVILHFNLCIISV